MPLFYTRKRLPRVIATLEKAGFTVAQTGDQQDSDAQIYSVTRSPGSMIRMFLTPGRAPVFDFRRSHGGDAADDVWFDLGVRLAKRFG